MHKRTSWYSLFILVCLPIFLAKADAPADIKAYTQANQAQILQDFKALLAIPNISAVPEDMFKNADWITAYIAERGFTSEVVTAGGAPYILAEKKVPGASKSILIYAHFDGQPVEPSNWATPPFEPTLIDKPIELGGKPVEWDGKAPLNPQWRLAARSAGDDKGPVIALMAALDAMEALNITPSVNIKLVLDGEEEIGSPTLEAILKEHGHKMDAELMLFCDGPMHPSRIQQLVFGMRGSMTLELTTYGALSPLHSGHYGNFSPNPTDRLMRLLTSMTDTDGNILIKGYNDQTRPISPAEQQAIDNIPNIDAQLRHDLAIAESLGKTVRVEEGVLKPAIIVKGFQAGGVGSQSRNIIQPEATASLNLRLSAGQTPAFLREKMEAHIVEQGFVITYDDPTIEMRRENKLLAKLEWRPGPYPAFRSEIDSPEAIKLTSIMDSLSTEPTILTPTLGGSLPIYLFEEALDMPIIILPIANHDNNQHGRNENLRLQNLWDAVEIYAAILSEYDR
ncbi:M20/M25/M40 family metallo-hydrolase [Glaciecola sp. XM2]|uniref:M20/M25/M40 family metallo-hydrolase n=1 Tax=Glaciecola sp. XM2 TaxID=1914931 RepID=UPI001BDE5B6E|nr:M20/M25/M40 family metallo-hydrolase [Glaciecola sp. XM2]MBT1451295.1 M20/M25/M40 family metallo-hydrolase [Glaciecola sp. XM2]